MLIATKQRQFSWFKVCLVGGMLITLISLSVYLNTVVAKSKLSIVTSTMLVRPLLASPESHDIDFTTNLPLKQ
jgi:hypothetical protein